MFGWSFGYQCAETCTLFVELSITGRVTWALNLIDNEMLGTKNAIKYLFY